HDQISQTSASHRRMITISMDHDDHQADLGDELINIAVFTDSTTTKPASAKSIGASHPHPKHSRQLLDIHRGISPVAGARTLAPVCAECGCLRWRKRYRRRQ
ncbi:MAG: hypothetical protein ACJ8H8_21430, partial [Geminicoccaceae bacterium]